MRVGCVLVRGVESRIDALEGRRISRTVVNLIVRVAARPCGSLLRQLQFRVVRVVVGSAEVRRRAGDIGGHGAERQVRRESDGVVGERRLHQVCAPVQQFGNEAPIVPGGNGDNLTVRVLLAQPVVVQIRPCPDLSARIGELSMALFCTMIPTSSCVFVE